jgi:hypothetical protein
MIMNKKIFTLLMGVILVIGSAFTASAATPTVHNKLPGGATSFADTLRIGNGPLNFADTRYVIRLTGIANNILSPATAPANFGTTDYVLFVDGKGQLRVDTITALDSSEKYGFWYNSDPAATEGSSKFAAIRRATWCVETKGTSAANRVFNFDNMETGERLEAPTPLAYRDLLWDIDPQGYGRYIYSRMETAAPKTGLNLVNDETLIIDDWHFSQTGVSGQPLQESMPIYAYTGNDDSVLVLTIDDAAYHTPVLADGSGGWAVTVKYVSANDLIADAVGNVRTGEPKAVSNVLLFSLRQLESFVLNQDDYNAIRTTIKFDPDATTAHDPANDVGWNPFTKQGTNVHGHGPLTAFEVSDSLYRYGYMQFQNEDLKWLAVDTGFWNLAGADMFLQFRFDDSRRDTSDWQENNNPVLWGNFEGGYPDGKPDSLTWLKGGIDPAFNSSVYWRWDSLFWAVARYAASSGNFNVSLIDADGIINPVAEWDELSPLEIKAEDIFVGLNSADAEAKWIEIVKAAEAIGFTSIWAAVNNFATFPLRLNSTSAFKTLFNLSGGNSLTNGSDYVAHASYNSNTNYWSAAAIADAGFHLDSINYLFTYNTDSLMENQSKFRVVYNPLNDQAVINVYQTRYRYLDYTDDYHPVRPDWWINSFRMVESPHGNGEIYRPSDYWKAHDDNAGYYENYYWVNSNTSDIGGAYNNNNVPNYLKPLDWLPTNNQDQYHSFMEYYQFSSPQYMDKVLISTADTSVFYVRDNPLSWQYKPGQFHTQTPIIYRDSLFYIGIQNLETSSKNIATLVESDHLKKITLGVISSCTPGDKDGKAAIPDNLYLIRNKAGQFLAVPIWSISDSVYWITPETDEDPTQVPSYQWVLENFSKNGGPSAFKLTNREFEKVVFDYAFVYASGDSILQLGGNHSASRLNKQKHAIVNDRRVNPMGPGFDISKETAQNLESFIPMSSTIKKSQLLGYTYIDPDSAFVDVYALKYKNLIAPRYIGWNGYDNPDDAVLYVNYKNEMDRLYFMLEEMPEDLIQDDEVISDANSADYKSIFDDYNAKHHKWNNSKGLVLEGFGYTPANNKIADLKPLARQAYRLLLKDYYMFSPTIDGNYVTLGEEDNYILADKLHASQQYVPGSGIDGLFGIPYFYLRNQFFNVPGQDKNGKNVDETYFALVQRLDTFKTGTSPAAWEDIKAYISQKWGPTALAKVAPQVEKSRELGLFLGLVEDASAKLKISLRGEGAVRLSTFTLEHDDDPIYRRFEKNDLMTRNPGEDRLLTLQFHRHNLQAQKLFENSGADKRTGGGWEYNLKNVDQPFGGLKADSLGNVISFLGLKNSIQFPAVTNADGYSNLLPDGSPEYTNYSIFVDTAYINRGTGWIKPQYLLAVDVIAEDESNVIKPGGCPSCPGQAGSGPDPNFVKYKLGRYLYNTAMYAKQIDPAATAEPIPYGNVYDVTLPVNRSVIASAINGVDGNAYTQGTTKWERLAFAWAIHRGDELFVLKIKEGTWRDALNSAYDKDPEILLAKLKAEYKHETYEGDIDFAKLRNANGRPIPNDQEIGVHAIVNLGNNYHKDWVFSFRYVERGSDVFIIESETEKRDWTSSNVIRPGYGGWVKFDNDVPVISTAGNVKELLIEGDLMNIELAEDVASVANDQVGKTASSPSVIGGTGNVTILNAPGKKVVITNLLGQTIASAVLSSDKASIAAPAGVVIVAIEGESAVKAVVK